MLLGMDIPIMPLCHIFPRLNGRVLARTVQRNDLCIMVRISEESDRSTGNSAVFFVFRDHNAVDLSSCRDDKQLKQSLLQRKVLGEFSSEISKVLVTMMVISYGDDDDGDDDVGDNDSGDAAAATDGDHNDD